MQHKFSLPALFTLAGLLMVWGLSAQNGVLRGTIIDDETGEPLFSANAVLKGTQIGTTTDFDGKFELRAEPGTYDLELTFIGMQSTTITDVKIAAGETNVIDVIRLKPSSSELDAVTVTAEATRNTEAALITVKKKSANLIDGISAAKLKETGDGNLGDAVKRITGVSVQGGKYVYVRGLGERYTKTLLNGVNIPGLDPDKNTLQIDIFPSNIVSNITIRKTALAELPADFAGGLVDIETKAFPSKKIFSVSGGVSFTPSMHFNPDYLTYDGSGTDFLGFDGGARTLPADARSEPIPSPAEPGFSDAETNDFLQEFSPELEARETMSPLNFSLGLELGDQITLDNGNKLGYIFSTSYRNETTFYDDLTYGEYQISPDDAQYEMVYSLRQNGQLGRNSVLLAGMGGLAYKTLKSKHKLVVTHLQSGESQAAQIKADNNGQATGQSGYLGFANNLEFFQRGLTNGLLSGNYYLQGGDLELEWKLAGTRSNIVEPDIRQTRFTVFPQSGDSLFIAGAGGNPRRIWRYLDETNLEGQINADYKHGLLGGGDAKLDIGLSYLYKQRDYEILTYDLQSFGASMSSLDFGGNPSAVLADSNLYPNGYNLYYASGNGEVGQNPNAFNSNARKFSLYASEELRPFQGMTATLGLRMEAFNQRHTGRDALYASSDGAQGNSLENEEVLDELNFFPSANLAFDVSENFKLRASYFRSIARPSFKELSFAQILDPLSNRIYNGSLFEYPSWEGNLQSTLIQNVDLRAELYGAPGELISLSLFAKTFDKPIELVRIPTAQTTNEFQTRNVGDGRLIGLELEARKNLGFLSESLKKFSFSGNLTLVQSQIDMTNLEYQNRLNFEKEEQEIDSLRPMAGQAPYVINAGVNYSDPERGINAGIYYNVKGRTLTVVGGGLFPDVYTDPFHNLKINLNKKLGEEQNQTLNLEISNLLLDTFDQYYSGFRAENQVFKAYSPGVTLSVGYSLNF
jgi:hypothetical protein